MHGPRWSSTRRSDECGVEPSRGGDAGGNETDFLNDVVGVKLSIDFLTLNDYVYLRKNMGNDDNYGPLGRLVERRLKVWGLV
jgi:hypothetical protein